MIGMKDPLKEGKCPVCNHDLRESYDESEHTRWECTHCPWGWTDYNHDDSERGKGRSVDTDTERGIPDE